MEKPISTQPFKNSFLEDSSKEALDTEFLNEHVLKFIEELTRGESPQEAARHSADFKNTSQNYRLEKIRHESYWK